MAFTAHCPSCGEPLDVDDEYRGWMVRCPHCRHEFYPDAPAAAPRPRRERGRRPTADETIYRAKQIVAGPASWLRVIGVLGLVAGAAGVALALVLVAMIADNPVQARKNLGVQNEEELIVNTVVIGICSTLGVAFGSLITYGAIKMGRLESHGWSVAASVLAISSLLYCTCCLFTGVPLGIWALVSLNNPDVRAGFDLVARQRHGDFDETDRDDPDDDADD